VYGTPRQLPVAETHPLSAFNPYAHSKILGEAVVDFHREHLAVRAAVIRPFNLYGPGQDQRFVVPAILRQLLDPTVREVVVADATPRRDYLYVGDFVALVLAVMGAAAAGTYNAGSGRSVSVAELAREAGIAAGVDKPLRGSGARRPNEILDVVADISRAREQLGWEPQVALIDGLRSMLAASSHPTACP
jgi:nucleoside-diphosphate-sugar epimerase